MTNGKMNDGDTNAGGMNDGGTNADDQGGEDRNREDRHREDRHREEKETRGSRGGEEVLAPGEVTKDAKGLGAVFGDADRTNTNDPVKSPGAADAQAINDMKENFTVYEHEGERYVEENPK